MTRSLGLTVAVFGTGLVVGVLSAWAASSLVRPPDHARQTSVTIYCPVPVVRSPTGAPASPAPRSWAGRACDVSSGPASSALKALSAKTSGPDTFLLDSSVVAALVAAAFNAYTTATARAGSLSDAVFSAYLRFNREARQYLADMEVQRDGRAEPSAELQASYADLRATLSRLPGTAAQRRVGLLEQAYAPLTSWPKGAAGAPGPVAHVMSTRTQLDGLEESMHDHARKLLRLPGRASGIAR